MINFFLILAALGLIIPYSRFIPFLQQNGFNLALFAEQMFANQIAAFFAWDVIISGTVLLAFIAADPRRTRLRWLDVAGLLTVGISFAFPFYLYLRAEER